MKFLKRLFKKKLKLTVTRHQYDMLNYRISVMEDNFVRMPLAVKTVDRMESLERKVDVLFDELNSKKK